MIPPLGSSLLHSVIAAVACLCSLNIQSEAAAGGLISAQRAESKQWDAMVGVFKGRRTSVFVSVCLLGLELIYAQGSRVINSQFVQKFKYASKNEEPSGAKRSEP